MQKKPPANHAAAISHKHWCESALKNSTAKAETAQCLVALNSIIAWFYFLFQIMVNKCGIYKRLFLYAQLKIVGLK